MRSLAIRPLVLGCALLSGLAGGACKTEDLHPADAGPDPNRWTGSVGSVNHAVDILFVIDDSSDMALAQDNLIRNFPTFMSTLQGDPSDLPNYHIAVVSTDMGAGDSSIAGCDATRGKNGIFQYTPRGSCNASNLQPGQTFIVNAGGYADYTGKVADVFGCIAALGESGCGFQHPFAAMLRALGADGSYLPQENQAFLRPEAVLAIVMLTHEDDCSAAPGNGPNERVPLFDTSANLDMASQLGPPTHFRCNEFGHMCPKGMTGDAGRAVPHPDRNAPNQDVNAMVTYAGCTSDDTEGYLLSTQQTADALKSLKADPSRIVVASIQGSPAPYTVHWSAPSPADSSCGAASCPWPAITHACSATDGRTGDPGVRTAQLAQQFGASGVVGSICDDSFGPSLDSVATAIKHLFGPGCLPGQVGLRADGQPDCKVAMYYADGSGGSTSSTVPACADNGNAAPCWQIETTPTCPGQALVVSPDPNAPPTGATAITYDCAKPPSP